MNSTTKTTKSSKSWLRRQARDPFVHQARRAEYRSRAAFKLMEIDRRDRLIRPGMTVFDVGAAPGSWSQYVSERVGERGRVFAVDVLPIAPLRNVECVQGDFMDPATVSRCVALLHSAPVDLVISDLAPNLSGIRSTDQARSMELAGQVRDFACRVLRPGGDLLLKMFQGQGVKEFRQELLERFQAVISRKPRASRDSSREIYVLARGYKV